MSRALGSSDRLRLARSATRTLGPYLIVSHGGATQRVKLFAGCGPSVWRCLEEGLTLGDAVDRLVRTTGSSTTLVEQDVLRFATSLVGAGLAELEP
jgi:hypothetical protein